MPVNTAALKTFAPAMRRQLLEAVGRKLDLLLNTQTPDTLSTYAKQIAELREQEAENREHLLEQVAYTWFNRLCALRYLDARGWHPFGCKVLMPAADGETQPEPLKLMRAGSLPGELKPHTNEARLHRLLDGHIPPAMAGSDPQGEVYRELVLASCRSYHRLLPELFEGLDDASELLLPDDLLSEGSIAGGFRSAISDEDCDNVEIIGWLYQFYISEKKDQVIGKVVKSDDIPAATQLFTPNWIVKYMVQNSLGATWLATYPESPLKDQMEFYIKPAEQTQEVQVQLAAITPESLDPEALTLIDPACGSGHILVEAYNLLKAIYLERGYRQRDIPELILSKNLYGLDICPRAAQLASFSLLMKGREDDRRLLERGVKLNVMALQDSTGLNVERMTASVDLSAAGVSRTDVRMLTELFTHATTFGSLIQVPSVLADKLPALSLLAQQSSQDIFASSEIQRLELLVRQAELLASRYDMVAANPPYMGAKFYSSELKNFVNDNYCDGKADLYGCFIQRTASLCIKNGRLALITIPNWMFLSGFEELRQSLLDNLVIETFSHNGRGLWGSDFGSCSFTLRNSWLQSFRGTYKRLFTKQGSVSSNSELESSFHSCRTFLASGKEFKAIPGAPIAYWVSNDLRRSFTDNSPLIDRVRPLVGLQTSDNARFLRLWHEVDYSRCCFTAKGKDSAVQSGCRWFPLNKGGGFRKWYGLNEFVINWHADGAELKQSITQRLGSTSFTKEIRSEAMYFRENLTWGLISVASPSFRYTKTGSIFNISGPSLFPRENLLFLAGLLNSVVVRHFLEVLSPSVSFTPGMIGKIPAVESVSDDEVVVEGVKRAISVAEADWNSFEPSWEFNSLPLLTAVHNPTTTLESNYTAWITQNKILIAEMKRLEEKNSRLFIDAYGLNDELTPEMPIEQITLTVNPAYRYGGNITEDELWVRFRQDAIKEFLSYATGCMMGRYSLDQSGLILADSLEAQTVHLAAYEERVGKPLSEVQFKPDPDGIIPVLDGEWFEDDIVARTREFLGVTFLESSIAENLRFIEESLGKDIRKYFCTEFYKDHLQTYKKRPIYWMVQSPKKGFACLIYLHRYTKDSLNQVLNNYFRPYLQKLEARLAQLGLDQLNDDLPARERTAARKEAEKITKVLKECQAWEQDALLPMAQQRIELDLDDGVKVNYLKLQDVLAPIPGLAAKED